MKRICSETLGVAACQMRSTDEIDQNQNQINQFLKHFESDQVDLVSFPENCLYFRIDKSKKFDGFSKDDAYFSELGNWAKKYQTHIHLGSVPLKGKNSKLLNATIWIDRDGKINFPYSKIHLFDVDVVGEAPIRESDFFEYGSETSIVAIDQWKIGLSICYDLRFSELYLRYAKAEVDLILVPSAFLVPTGQAHWHTLLRARAIEAQAYVVAAAQGGEHSSKTNEKRYTYGHSLIIDPWGQILSEGADQSFVVQELTKKSIEKVRKQIPMKNHRRLER